MVLFGGLWTRIPPAGSYHRLLKNNDARHICDDKEHDQIITSTENNDDALARGDPHHMQVSHHHDSNNDSKSKRGDLPYQYNSINNTNENESSNLKPDESGQGERPQGSIFSNQYAIPPSSFRQDEQEKPSLTSEFVASEADMQVLKLCAFYTAIYMGVAVIAFSFVFEKWTIIDSMYFAVSTFTTCGYGNLTPTTEAGQIFTIFFAIYGVIILGVFIGIIGHSISVAQNRALRKLKKERQEEILESLFTDDESQRKECDELLREGLLYDHVSLMDDIKRVVISELPAILLVAGAALILGLRERWSFVSTLYFCIMSATTTGFGDYSPTSQEDKLYCIFFLPLAVAVFGEVLGRIAGVYIQRKVRRAEIKFLHRSVTRCDISRMDTNHDGEVDMLEFLTFMLVALQKVDKASIDDLKTIFRSLDMNGNGVLDKDDLVELVAERFDKEDLIGLGEQNPLLDDDGNGSETVTSVSSP
jgi:potassium channel subfamily K